MPKIHKLSNDLINKIAAGEVIERPASVVKELVENSLDAESTKIYVTIKEGGKKLIEVVDDGVGMSPDQLPLAIQRHATSKIQKFDDLFHLQTSGFRGEALASISSVAKVSVASQNEGHEASEILVENGQILDQRACAQAPGTKISVKYLFYQTPARLKFLKTKETETSHIESILTKVALSHPEVAFRLIQNDRILMDVPAGQSMRERTLNLLGRDLEGYLYDFHGEVPGMTVSGLLSHPQMSRSQRTSTFFFVNGRPVSDKVLWHAVLEAYRDLLMKGKYPVMVLFLNVDEQTLDVNVHPTKAEIRFHHSSQVHSFVYRAVRDKLKESPWLKQQVQDSSSVSSAAAMAQSSVKQSLENWSQNYFQSSSEAPTQASAPVSYSTSRPTLSYSADRVGYKPQGDPNQRKIEFGKTAYASMSPIGQLLGTYILCEIEGKLILIDQHAAHERVGFEKLIKQYEEEGIVSQPRLIPETFDLKPTDTDILKRYLGEFMKFGFEIEHFGGNTFVLKGEPAILLGKIDFQKFIVDLIEDLKATGELTSLKDKLHHVLATMACHAQIRANHHLTMTEMTALLNELEEYQFTDFCPHGRPVSVEVTLDEIEKWFKRTL